MSVLTLASIALFAGCGIENSMGTDPITSGGGEPNVIVDPERLEFGEASADDMVVKSFIVGNDGDATLEVSSVEIGGEVASFTILNEDTSFQLPPTAEEEIQVAFTPLNSSEIRANAVVRSNDEDTPSLPVELIGTGLVPDIEIQPDPYDFGQELVGCTQVADFKVVNVGKEPVNVSALEFTGTGFTVINLPATPFTLTNNGDFQPFQVQFIPDGESLYDAEIAAISDAPGSPDLGAITGEGLWAGSTTEKWRLDEEPPVDLMFVVDQSGSMDDDQRSLADNFGTFISELSSYTTGWQVMVVNAYNGCNNSGILDGHTTNYQRIFQDAVKQGSQTEWESNGESGLLVATAGMSVTDSGECNYGFLRPDALLHIIIVTDEVDQGPDGWSSYVGRIQAKKGDVDLTKISAIAGDYPSGCGSAEPGRGVYEAVMATHGVFLSICSDWGANVEDLANASVPQTTFTLSHSPEPSTITVEVNGVNRGGGWHYEAAQNAVIFDTDYPEGGSLVEISYKYAPVCD